MSKILELGQCYTGRAQGVVPINISIDRDAYELLRQHAPTTKAYGRFLSRLVYEHQARIEERLKRRKEKDPADNM